MRVAFRADASYDLGTGHVMRCLSLAKGLQDRGHRCSFVCRGTPGNLIEQITIGGIEVAELGGRRNYGQLDLASDPVGGSDSWSQENWQIDVWETLGVIEQEIDWVVVDHYALDARWERMVRPKCKRLMVIDDLNNRRHDCDLLLDQNWFGGSTSNRYNDKVPATCTLLRGPVYALLGPEYSELREKMPARDGNVKNILVFFGGSDSTNETGKVIDAIRELRTQEELAVTVIIGQNHPCPQDLYDRAKRCPNVTLHNYVTSLATVMRDSDLMIGAGGATTWERMCLGLPGIVISVADNQDEANMALAKAGYITFLGKHECVTTKDITATLECALTNPVMLREQSKRMSKLTGGVGVDLVCGYLEKLI